MSKTGFAMFLAGATVGAAATWLCLRRYYEQITQEEIDSVKAAFAERKPVIANIAKDEKSNEKQEENQHKADIAKLKPDLVNYAAKLQEEGYINYTEHSKKNTEEKKDEPIQDLEIRSMRDEIGNLKNEIKELTLMLPPCLLPSYRSPPDDEKSPGIFYLQEDFE